MCPWAHGPTGPWAYGPMGPWAHGPMGPWAHGPWSCTLVSGGGRLPPPETRVHPGAKPVSGGPVGWALCIEYQIQPPFVTNRNMHVSRGSHGTPPETGLCPGLYPSFRGGTERGARPWPMGPWALRALKGPLRAIYNNENSKMTISRHHEGLQSSPRGC